MGKQTGTYRTAAEIRGEHRAMQNKLKTHHEEEIQLKKDQYKSEGSEYFAKAKEFLGQSKAEIIAAGIAFGTSVYDFSNAVYQSVGQGLIGTSWRQSGAIGELKDSQADERTAVTHQYAKELEDAIIGVNGHIGELKTEEAKIREKLDEVTGAKWGARYEKVKLHLSKATL